MMASSEQLDGKSRLSICKSLIAFRLKFEHVSSFNIVVGLLFQVLGINTSKIRAVSPPFFRFVRKAAVYISLRGKARCFIAEVSMDIWIFGCGIVDFFDTTSEAI